MSSIRSSGAFQPRNARSSIDRISAGGGDEGTTPLARRDPREALREAGRPTLLILDDALVHSDAQRLAQMKRVIYDVAQRHQVLLFTCHPAHWRDLGAPARPIQAL